MKRKVLTSLSGLLAIILFSILSLTGCSGDGDSFTSLTGLAKMAPQDSETIIFIDIKKIKSDGDLSELYEEMKDSFEYEIAADGSDMDFDDIHYLGMTEVNGQEVIWVNGDFDLDALRDELDDDYDKDDYSGVEVWYGYGDAVAIHNSTLIIGDEDSVKESIKSLVNPESSIYEKNEDIRDVVKELTSGLASTIMYEGYYPGALAIGMTLSKLNADVIKFSGCFKFDDEDSAEDALSDIESDIESSNMYRAADVSRSGSLIKFSAEIDIEEIGPLW
jgi:hypothetical protein